MADPTAVLRDGGPLVEVSQLPPEVAGFTLVTSAMIRRYSLDEIRGYSCGAATTAAPEQAVALPGSPDRPPSAASLTYVQHPAALADRRSACRALGEAITVLVLPAPVGEIPDDERTNLDGVDCQISSSDLLVGECQVVVDDVVYLGHGTTDMSQAESAEWLTDFADKLGASE